MPRRQFIADLQEAKDGTLPPNLRNLEAGEDDGQFVFTFDAPGGIVTVTTIIPDVSEYPKSHEYMIFCSDDAPKQLADHLQKLTGTTGKTIAQLLELVSSHLSDSAASQNQGLGDDNGEELIEETDDEVMDDYDNDDIFLLHAPAPSTANTSNFKTTSSRFKGNPILRSRIRSDLRLLKQGGFHFSVIGKIDAGTDCYITISIRVSKLGISVEAMQAWRVHPSQYLTLVIHYPLGYQSYESYISNNARSKTLASHFDVRIAYSATHKPLAQDVISLFQSRQAPDETLHKTGDGADTIGGMEHTFISKSLIDLVDAHFAPVLKLRASGMTWHGAESFYHLWSDSARPEEEDNTKPEYFEPESFSTSIPAIVQADHMADSKFDERSLPLITMQFILRHFVRCTEFCMTCHRHIESDLEAIKPYVCQKPLCLWQYMSMGFGSSIEHEIQSQPSVVDLLISFCYSAAYERRLKDRPIGLGILLPPPSTSTPYRPQQQYGFRPSYQAAIEIEEEKPEVSRKEYKVDFDRERCELVFTGPLDGGCPVARGSWIVVSVGSGTSSCSEELHCRVVATNFFPSITIEEPIPVGPAVFQDQFPYGKAYQDTPPMRPQNAQTPATPATTPRAVPATMVKYDIEFEALTKDQQCEAVCRLLNTLPSVSDMKEYLSVGQHSRDIRSWSQRITPSALQLLRWIIASNRACIMQVEEHSGEGPTKLPGLGDELISGMPGFMQFRFAMGAPDKEERFMKAVKATTTRLNLKYPTFFAWHGSPLRNWHGILREGLNFDRADNGRAYGDGVYHAYDVNTSLGYSRLRTACAWPNSDLKVTMAVALNELVNARGEFQSAYPYAVVKQLDWIQTRYLLVQCGMASQTTGANVTVAQAFPQDPTCTPRGLHGPIVVPAAAIKSGRLRSSAGQSAPKKLKGANGQAIATDVSSEYSSDVSDHGDLLQDEVEEIVESFSQPLVVAGTKKAHKGDFVPGTLDYATLPLLPLPSYATTATTKRLMSEVTSMRKSLEGSELSDLGWYINFEKLDNVYQWIVELHSFDTFEVKGRPLPLVADMKNAGVKSVVLEVRFGPDFPYSPPFVRVVRPRFKTISEGGGGHVVMGGAMCMELLTNTGWSSISSMDSVLLQVRLAIATEPFARLHTHARGDYGAREAADGFIRACQAHGWKEPLGFRELAYGIGPGTGGRRGR